MTATPRVPATTQQAYPGRATARTVVATALGFVLTAGVIVPLVLQAMDDTLGDLIPPKTRGVIVAIGGAVVAVSAFLTRVMAIPKVDAWLHRLGLSSSVEPTVPPQDGGGL
jgi:hypothetical protein